MKAIPKNNSFSSIENWEKTWEEKEENFQCILEKIIKDEIQNSQYSIDPKSSITDEFRILLPKHHHFWDNGYEDIDF